MTTIDNVDSINVLTDGPLRKTIRIDAHLGKSALHPGHLPRRRRRHRPHRQHHRLARKARPPQSRLSARRHQRQGHLRDPLRLHRTPHHPQQQPGRKPSSKSPPCAGPTSATTSRASPSSTTPSTATTPSATPSASRCSARPPGPTPTPTAAASTSPTPSTPTPAPGSRPQTVHRGYELNDPLTATQVFAHTGTLPADALLRRRRKPQRNPHRHQKGRRRRRPHLPHVRVGREPPPTSNSTSPRRHLRRRNQPDGEARGPHLRLRRHASPSPSSPTKSSPSSPLPPPRRAGDRHQLVLAQTHES